MLRILILLNSINQIRSDQIRSDQIRSDQIKSNQIKSRSQGLFRSSHQPYRGTPSTFTLRENIFLQEIAKTGKTCKFPPSRALTLERYGGTAGIPEECAGVKDKGLVGWDLECSGVLQEQVYCSSRMENHELQGINLLLDTT